MDFTLDVGGLFLGIVTVAVIPTAAWFLNRSHRDRVARQEQYEEAKEVVDIQASLTTPEVIDALARARDDDAAKHFLLALHTRSIYRFEALERFTDLPRQFREDITHALDAISHHWEEETKESQETFNRKLGRSRVEDPQVQQRMRAFVAHLAGSSTESIRPGGDAQVVAQRYQKVVSSIRLTKGSQGAFLGLPGGEFEIYFAGRGKMVDEHGTGAVDQWKENLPAQIRHRHQGQNLSMCSLASVKHGSLILRLQDQNETGEQLAKAFVEELERLAGIDGEGTCGCGVPFMPVPQEATTPESRSGEPRRS